jgi:hypothetical protein
LGTLILVLTINILKIYRMGTGLYMYFDTYCFEADYIIRFGSAQRSNQQVLQIELTQRTEKYIAVPPGISLTPCELTILSDVIWPMQQISYMLAR